MSKVLRLAFFLIVVLVFLSRGDCHARQRIKKKVQRASVTGTYKYTLNKLEVLELPDYKVRINFMGVWPNDRTRVETRNMGGFDETVPLVGRRATVKLQFGEDPCIIKLDFRSNKVIVRQEGSILGCGFGFNVEPDGTYVKVSSKPPSLPPPEKSGL